MRQLNGRDTFLSLCACFSALLYYGFIQALLFSGVKVGRFVALIGAVAMGKPNETATLELASSTLLGRPFGVRDLLLLVFSTGFVFVLWRDVLLADWANWWFLWPAERLWSLHERVLSGSTWIQITYLGLMVPVAVAPVAVPVGAAILYMHTRRGQTPMHLALLLAAAAIVALSQTVIIASASLGGVIGIEIIVDASLVVALLTILTLALALMLVAAPMAVVECKMRGFARREMWLSIWGVVLAVDYALFFEYVLAACYIGSNA